jgi:hypothetical protein
MKRAAKLTCVNAGSRQTLNQPGDVVGWTQTLNQVPLREVPNTYQENEVIQTTTRARNCNIFITGHFPPNGK